MVREDLVEGAIAFLQDPSVASAPLEQRVAFLRSKNLTQDEIDASLARVGQVVATSSPQSSAVQQQYRQQPPQQQYGSYQQQAYPPYWQQPPPELPQRDWRDWFIAATVMGGVGYGLYWTAKRYVVPLISPPTPAQIEQDKASIDASFEKTFALLEQLATDTQELKDSELERKERLDKALLEVESIIDKIKQANEERDVEAKRVAREISEIRDQIPKAIEKEKETTDNRLKDLSIEMKSLKTLVANRMSGGVPPARTTPSFSSQQSSAANGLSAYQSAAPITHDAPATPVLTSTSNDVNGAGHTNSNANAGAVESPQSNAGSSYNRLLGGKAAIPSWQLAAKKRTEEAKAEHLNGAPNTSESGTITESSDGI